VVRASGLHISNEPGKQALNHLDEFVVRASGLHISNEPGKQAFNHLGGFVVRASRLHTTTARPTGRSGGNFQL
jgi:hypothetical protein